MGTELRALVVRTSSARIPKKKQFQLPRLIPQNCYLKSISQVSISLNQNAWSVHPILEISCTFAAEKKKISILASPKLKLGCWISNQFLGLNGQKFKTANVQINMAQEEKKNKNRTLLEFVMFGKRKLLELTTSCTPRVRKRIRVWNSKPCSCLRPSG